MYNFGLGSLRNSPARLLCVQRPACRWPQLGPGGAPPPGGPPPKAIAHPSQASLPPKAIMAIHVMGIMNSGT